MTATVERHENTALHGMKAIRTYLGGKSENTVLKLIRREDLPAAKIGGEWVSDRKAIDQWRLSRVAGRIQLPEMQRGANNLPLSGR